MSKRSHRWLFAAAIALGCSVTTFEIEAASSGNAEPSVRIVTGEIEGAKYILASADQWNRQLLIYAHGYKPTEAPLKAELPIDDPAYSKLLSDGWMLAATSYRRNGLVVHDAIADINALRDHIERIEGTPGLVILLGESMGGAIVTLMAENEPGRYQGAIAIGAALQAQDPVYPLAITHRPKIPVIFLTNRSELEGPAAYVEQAAEAPVPPALWRIDRDGHVNVNYAERLVAIDGLITWITSNQIERENDATVAIETGSHSVTFSEHAAHGAVESVTDGFGNIFTSFRPEDLAAIGIKPGTDFELTAGGQKWRVRYGSDYSDVPKGAWVAFDRAEGLILIARNYANAAETAGVTAGDALTIAPLAQP